MVNSMVARATNNNLIGPDWALNLEVCDLCNRDTLKAKDVVKGIKKRLGSRNPKVQLLALTLLETLMKNCGDFVHTYVAERNVLRDMLKIVKKKHPDFHVKEKILILIDTWQEGFGGARGRYPQFYAAYLELLRLGASFPENSAQLAPVVTPPQTQQITSYPHNPEHENENETGVHTAEDDFPTLSFTELQTARGIMEVLAEMLTAVDPGKREGLRQEVIVDLVEQCRTYKKRLVHLVNTTSNESLLSQGLALNDDLARVLAKHEALLAGTHVISSEKSKPETSKPETSQALVPVATPLTNANGTKQPGSASGVAEPDLISLAPAKTNGESTSTANVNANFDLLSGDDFDYSNPLAIVPVGDTQPATSPVSQENALALVSLFPPQTQQPRNMSAQLHRNMSAQQGSFYPNGNVAQNQSWVAFNQGNNPGWNGHMDQQQQQQPPLQGFGGGMINPSSQPPWEAPSAGNPFVGGGAPQYLQPLGLQNQVNSNMMYANQMGQQMYPNQIQQMGQQMYPNQIQQQMYSNQIQQQMGQQMYPNQIQQQMGQQMYPNQIQQQMGQQMYPNQMGQVYGTYGYANGYGYGQQQNMQTIGKRMAGMSVKDERLLTNTVYTGPSMANASYVHVQADKLQKPEDALFGDLMDFSKVKPKKT